MSERLMLQRTILEQLRRTRTPMTVFLRNGFQFRGTLEAADAITMIFNEEGTQKIIFTQNVSTIVPECPLNVGALIHEAIKQSAKAGE